jgi:hypothetical protein
MSASGFTPISIYYSTTASAVPTAANLVPGELAINTADGKLYYEDSSGVVQVLATKSTGSIGGSNTQVQFNNSGSLGGSSGLTWDGSFLTTSSIKNSALTSGRVTFAGASGLLSDSAGLTYNGASLTISSGASASALIATSTSAGGTALNIQNSGTVNALIGGYLSCIGSGSATDVAIAAYQGALAFATNGANERMRITSAGNVGIGTSSPSTIFTINGNDPLITLKNGDVNRWQFGLENTTSNRFVFYDNTASAYRLILDSDGDLGIGATNPVAKLQVKGSGTSGQVTASFILENSSSGTGGMDITGSAGASRWRFLYGGGPSTGTNALTEAMCIGTEGTSAGLVGIGTSSPSSLLQVGVGSPRETTASFFGTGNSISSSIGTVGIYSTDTTGANVGPSIALGGQTGNAVNPYPFGFIQGAKNSATAGDYGGYLRFLTIPSNGGSPVQNLVLNTGGGITALSTIGVGSVTPSASGAGITFPATQSASSDANTLDDYEEGTWSFGFTSTTGTITKSATFVNAAYTKVGRVVTVTGFLAVASVSAPTGVLTVTGLPFPIGTLNRENYVAGGVFGSLLAVGSVSPLMISGVAGSSSLTISKFVAGSSADLAGDVVADARFYVSVTYFTD